MTNKFFKLIMIVLFGNFICENAEASKLDAGQMKVIKQFNDELTKAVSEVPTPPSTGTGRTKVFNENDPTYIASIKSWLTGNSSLLNDFPSRLRAVILICGAVKDTSCIKQCGTLDGALRQPGSKIAALFAGGARLGVVPCKEALETIINSNKEAEPPKSSATMDIEQTTTKTITAQQRKRFAVMLPKPKK